jgi:beta-galactosidase/beta-glucuronidase
MTIPRAEHPTPQMMRDVWINLNGEWEFEVDSGRSGRERGLAEAERLERTIIVPFCPESELSGVGIKDFMPAVWYRRSFTLPDDWAGERAILHFGAVDYESAVWVNGRSVGKHRGGYNSFAFEVTDQLRPGENVITVCAEDDVRTGLQPGGKQSGKYGSFGCMYTRTTGIWQTVWLERVPTTYVKSIKITPDLENGCAHISAVVDGDWRGGDLHVQAKFDGCTVGEASVKVGGGIAVCTIKVEESQVRQWSPGNPALYDLVVRLERNGAEIDKFSSYFGLRSLGWSGPALLLNGKPVFQRLILDQGFYPDGICTAPSDDELRRDIERSMAMGFNGARLHQKVFEERFLYWADKLGYIVWGEMANWGLAYANGQASMNFISEWMDVVERDYNHPSIVGWCPFNETWEGVFPDLLGLVYKLTKQFDPTRPVIDTSGNYHVGSTDVYDGHDYTQDPEKFATIHADFAAGGEPHVYFPGKDAPYDGQPYFISEYGGIWWNPGQADDSSWGYGDRPKSADEFIERYRGLTHALIDHPRMCGFCYTQLTDVEQEVNGLYTYERKPKFDPEVIKAINTRVAAIEKE